MKTVFKNISHILFIFVLSIGNKTSLHALSDTLYICAGESIQLQTTPNQYTYNWTPNENINNDTIFNPIVNPTETTTYFVEVGVAPNVNLINNWDFSQGNTGFFSDYFYTSNSTTNQQHYGVFTNPTEFNSWFGSCADHSPSDDDLMLIVDGAVSSNLNAWCQEISVTPDETYIFSAWITNIFWQLPPLLEFSINDIPLSPEMQVNGQLCNWEEYTSEWYSGNNTTAMICVGTISTDVDGNDFAMDDIVFSVPKEDFIDTFTVVVLENSLVNIEPVLCANESFYYDGIEVPAGTQLELNYTTANGCDSLIYINVNSIDTSYFETRVNDLCPGDTTYYLGNPITSDTSICEVYTNYHGCDSSICFVVYFFSEASIAIESELPSCVGDSDGALVANPFAGVPPYSYMWNTGYTVAEIDNLDAGIYSITITDSNGCQAEKNIELADPPALNLDYSYFEPSCFGVSDGQITINISGGTPGYTITFNDQVSSTQNVFNNIAGGSYEILVKDVNNCFSEFSLDITQPTPINISLEPEIQLPLGCPYQITADIIAEYDYQIQWVPSSNLSCLSCENPITSTIQDISYQLLVEDNTGCIALDTVDVNIIAAYEIYIPSAFSPNGDKVNDFFEIYVGKDVERIVSFKIFNRWGAEIFQQSDYLPSDPDGRWDGTFKSQLNAPGVFVYVVEVLFLDGVEQVFVGDVLLVK